MEGASVTCTSPGSGIATLTINRPAQRNVLTMAIKQQLADQLERLSADAAVHVVILTGAGGVFVAGTDIGEMVAMSPTRHTLLATERVFKALRVCPKILIAAVEGYALGGGCELALACDMIVAGAGARFGQPEIRVGIMPGAGATQLLVRTIGKYRAMKMMLTGEAIEVDEALRMGLISEAVADGQALARAEQLAGAIIGMPPLAVRAIKEVVHLGQGAPLEIGFALERKAFQLLFDSADQKEGMRAFIEKRKPVYQGK